MQKKLAFISMAFALATNNAKAADAVQSCYNRANTQSELNVCAGLDSKRADDEMNSVFQAVLKKYHDDSAFTKKLQNAQRAWLKWRDAEMEATYPDKDNPTSYGSSFPMCWSNELAAITSERTNQLRKWIDGVPEGDVCAGSVPNR